MKQEQPTPEQKTKFSLGALVMTIGVQGLLADHVVDLLEKHNENGGKEDRDQAALTEKFATLAKIDLLSCLIRHRQGDWGDVCKEDSKSNDRALVDDTRLLSSYQLFGTKIWIITEWDRSATTVLFPSEY